jgi:peptide/nickel transport system permease protein
MTLKNIGENLLEFWNDFKLEKIGIVGLAIILLSLVIIVFEPLISPYPEASDRWNDLYYWHNLPRNAPPAWTNLFAAQKAAETQVIKDFDLIDFERDGKKGKRFILSYDYGYDVNPRDLLFEADNKGRFELKIALTRPDERVVELYNQAISDDDIRVSVHNDCASTTFDWLRKSGFESQANINRAMNRLDPAQLLYLVAKQNTTRELPSLKGRYTATIEFLALESGSTVGNIKMTQVGRVHGLLGTDNSKHDLVSGIIAGLKWAMIIGLSIAIVSIVIGVVYGVVMAYYGGWVDSIMNTIFEIFSNMPTLPLLIVVSAVYKISLGTLIVTMIVFGWTGPVKLVRSIALAYKEETFIEAAKALGASHSRIIFKHLLPLLIPYSFSMMSMAVPGAILSEASLALLGLGDPLIVTWGKILNGAGQGAAANGLWWQIIPPGLCIAIMGAAFAFIGFSMDKILHPKLRTR